MARSAPTIERCTRCALHVPLCMCGLVSPLPVETRVVVIQHITESGRSSNSGRLVPLTLAGGELHIRGLPDRAFDGPRLAEPGRRVVMLYPLPGAPVLAPDPHDPRPVTLLVPDGNWRQARKMVQREPVLRAATKVRLAPGPPSRYRLRSHPDPQRIATFEAVARALGALEGLAVQRRLEHWFDVFVERTLWTRGDLSSDAVTGGIPGRGRRARARGDGDPRSHRP